MAPPPEPVEVPEPLDWLPPCPCCGGRMTIIETFGRWRQPRAPPHATAPTGSSPSLTRHGLRSPQAAKPPLRRMPHGAPFAMARIEQPLAIPREMSSRSARVSAPRERRRADGTIPPWRANRKWMTCLSLPSARPIAFNELSNLPTAPHIGPLGRRQLPSSLHDEHHLLEKRVISVVLHRPVEPALLHGNWLFGRISSLR